VWLNHQAHGIWDTLFPQFRVYLNFGTSTAR
jgi:hypothetical protein